MPCHWLKLEDGTVAHIRMSNPRRVKCHNCSRWSQFLCDFEIGGMKQGKPKTCDRRLCEKCVRPQSKDIDYCDEHNKIARYGANMKSKCRSCNTDIYWLKAQNKDGTLSVKTNPVDIDRHEKGNIIIAPDGRRYRIATKEEMQTAKERGIKLYISHFVTCPNSAKHKEAAKEKAVMLSKRVARDKATAALHGPVTKG